MHILFALTEEIFKWVWTSGENFKYRNTVDIFRCCSVTACVERHLFTYRLLEGYGNTEGRKGPTKLDVEGTGKEYGRREGKR
jgi:hypothetical protein